MTDYVFEATIRDYIEHKLIPELEQNTRRKNHAMIYFLLGKLVMLSELLSARQSGDKNSIKVDHQINQLNQCTGVPQDNLRTLSVEQPSGTVCVNQGDSADQNRYPLLVNRDQELPIMEAQHNQFDHRTHLFYTLSP